MKIIGPRKKTFKSDRKAITVDCLLAILMIKKVLYHYVICELNNLLKLLEMRGEA